MGKVTNNEGKDLQTKLKSTTHLLYFCSWEIANQKEKVGLSWGLFDSEWSVKAQYTVNHAKFLL